MKAFLKRSLARVIPQIRVSYRGLSVEGAFEDFGLLRALAKGSREPFMTSLFEQALVKGDDVADVGAHLGHYTLLGAATLRKLGGGVVHAFEPNARCFRYLERNVEKNGFAAEVKPSRVAVGAAPGTAELFADELQSDFSSLVAARDGADGVKKEVVPVTTLDLYFEGRSAPGVIKVDVEGFECAAVEGMRATLARRAPSGRRPVLFIESNTSALAAAGQSAPTLVAALRGAGLEPRVLDEERAELVPFDPARHASGCWNLMARARD